MTAFTAPILWGPLTFATSVNTATTSTFAGYYLDDADDSEAIVCVAPKDGTIDAVGVYINAITGNPPAYYFGLVTVDTSTGAPNTAAYGGSAIETYDFTATGWVWVTLATPATAAAGDLFAVRVWPTGTAPDTSNRIQVVYDNILSMGLPYAIQFATGWNKNLFSTSMAARYSTGEIVGFPIVSYLFANVDSGTTPDEVGNKFVPPAGMKCIGVRTCFRARAAGGTYTAKLYDSANNLLASVSSFAPVVSDNNTSPYNLYWDEVSLTAGETYRVTILPNSTTDANPAAFDFESETSKNNTIPSGSNWQATYRTDAGAWTDDASGVVWLSLLISDITFSTSSGGGAYGFAG